jgi:hypothetical protein
MAAPYQPEPARTTLSENIMQGSRLTQCGNGSTPHSDGACGPPTSGQKWWAAVLLGLIFLVLSSPSFYTLSNGLARTIGGPFTLGERGPTLWGLLVHTLLFVLVVRLILW